MTHQLLRGMSMEKPWTQAMPLEQGGKEKPRSLLPNPFWSQSAHAQVTGLGKKKKKRKKRAPKSQL